MAKPNNSSPENFTNVWSIPYVSLENDRLARLNKGIRRITERICGLLITEGDPNTHKGMKGMAIYRALWPNPISKQVIQTELGVIQTLTTTVNYIKSGS